jgi:hypothetical protein
MKNLNILAYNLFLGEDNEQIIYIKENDFDILLLSEASNDIDKKLDNYLGHTVESHCGYTYLGINKKFNIEVLNILNSIGIVIMHLKINSNEMVICSIHLTPYKKNAKIRNIQMFKINEILEDLNLLHLPIIIGGDTNMTDDEDEVIDEYGLIDVYLETNNEYYLTYPNREFMTKSKDSRITFVPKNDFRYDRFFIKNCEGKNFKTIPNLKSDHLAINVVINLIQ